MNCDIIGVHGKMGSGKDSLYTEFFFPLGYRKYQFSTPLYQMAQYQFNIECGIDEEINKHKLHALYVDVMGGKSRASYLDAVSFITVALPEMSLETKLFQDMTNKVKPRAFLQVVGTDYFRAINKDIWCDYLTSQIIKDIRKDVETFNEALDNEESNLILVGSGSNVEAKLMSKEFIRKYYISDIRFENEIQTVYTLGEKIKYSIPDMQWKKRLIKLSVNKESILSRVSERDSVNKEEIEKSLTHSSENELSDSLFDIVADANLSQYELYSGLETQLEGFI